MNTYMFNSRRLVACISLLALLVAQIGRAHV